MTSIMLEVHQALRNEKDDNSLIEQLSCDDVSRESLRPLDNLEVNESPKDLISGANSEVLIQSYKFETGSEGHYRIREALDEVRERAQKQQSPVTVNILINTRGKLPELLLKPNEQVNLRDELPAENEFFHVNIVYHQAEAFGSYHSKMIIVDGREAILRGGEPSRVNTATKENTSKKEPLVETGARFSGPLVGCLREDFTRSWNKHCDDSQKMSLQSTQVADDTNSLSVGFISKKANGNPLFYRDKKGPFKIAYLKALESAEDNVKIITPNLNDPDIIKAIADACNRGVKVQILMSKTFNDPREAKLGGTNTDSVRKVVRLIDRRNLQNLKINWSTNRQDEVTKLQEQGSVHGKYACFDDKFVLTGSSPLDLQGTLYSKEADIFFEDPAKAKEFNQKLFEPKYNSGKNYVQDSYDAICQLLLANFKDSNGQCYSNIDDLIAEEVDSKTLLYMQNTKDPGTQAKALVDSLDKKVCSSLSSQDYSKYRKEVDKELGLLKAGDKADLDNATLYDKFAEAVVFIFTIAIASALEIHKSRDIISSMTIVLVIVKVFDIFRFSTKSSLMDDLPTPDSDDDISPRITVN